MRVIAGSARSLPLKTVEGIDTRPTTDRIKETLFNMLMPEIPGCRFLDLYAGSGGIGIEALSRGAAEAVFVEHAKPACGCIKDNLSFTHLDDKAQLLEMDVLSAIARLSGKGVFDVVYIDPPYRQDYERDVLTALYSSNIIDEYTLIVVEADLQTDLSYVTDLGFEVTKIKNYKTNKHLFLHKK
jgi:16S rRNA (guanine966-N2)-methyltransferase